MGIKEPRGVLEAPGAMVLIRAMKNSNTSPSNANSAATSAVPI